ncbi:MULTISPECIES: EF-P 5-aminopentanol modification-associated protein YfmF [Staphylococcus]|uniref:EF-P 5-aminopentanol modification-associated protein YfmF n=1 Tax=Staphylococcus TaxID=1279 RepID=UPI0008A4A50E|nr:MULTISPECIES: pitrilysin family protein [Staphylococcus]ARB77946.1 insulinase family protein [Staphylococcus lugdunensis]ARJ19065.1 peptidase M16 [Staphylococcus lugdunensis]MCH8641760.1 insulinase family protein [Staphylococcus lugdunensis]MDK7860384.1 pitrilysin family protein [Staphylococcus lugdunensis]MDU7269948.1 pitrilysin family protein [Staphylococcus lugdunensis]
MTEKEKQNNIHIFSTEKFKTTTITFKFMTPLNYETITQRSVLSKVLTRATQYFPTDKAFNQHLAGLYGAYINSSVSKYKNQHVVSISLEIVNERYLKDTTPLLEKGLDLLYEVIWNPLIHDKAFHNTYVTQEKTLLTKKLESMVDNKSQFAFLNLMKHMFKNEAYRFLATGQLEQIDQVTPTSLYNTYQAMITNDTSSVYIVGNVDEAHVTKMIEQKFPMPSITLEKVDKNLDLANEIQVQDIKDYDVVDQAKLNLGYRFPAIYGNANYYTFVVFNMMFGGDPSSVLFSEVREKQSLAYSIHSQIDGKNGYLFVLSGVSVDKYQVAKQTILDEFDKFKNGNFSEEKLALAKKVIASQRYESMDRPKSIIEIMHNQLLLDYPQSNEQYIDAINKVTKEDIIELVNQAQLDTIYVLTKGDDINE